jgi:hypothetical protein
MLTPGLTLTLKELFMKNRSLFALFAVLIALRDILSELWLTENPVVLQTFLQLWLLLQILAEQTI